MFAKHEPWQSARLFYSNPNYSNPSTTDRVPRTRVAL